MPGIESHFFAPLDLYDAALMNRDLDGAELQPGEGLDDLVENDTATAAIVDDGGAHVDLLTADAKMPNEDHKACQSKWCMQVADLKPYFFLSFAYSESEAHISRIKRHK